MVDRKGQVTQSTSPEKAAGSAQAVPEAKSNQVQGNGPAAISGKAETGRHSNQAQAAEFATNQADTSETQGGNLCSCGLENWYDLTTELLFPTKNRTHVG